MSSLGELCKVELPCNTTNARSMPTRFTHCSTAVSPCHSVACKTGDTIFNPPCVDFSRRQVPTCVAIWQHGEKCQPPNENSKKHCDRA